MDEVRHPTLQDRNPKAGWGRAGREMRGGKARMCRQRQCPQMLLSGGNAKGGGDGVRHECADGFDNSLAGAGGG